MHVFNRLLAAILVFACCAVPAGCTQMREAQRDEISQLIGQRVHSELSLASRAERDKMLGELRHQIDQRVSQGIDVAIGAARREAAVALKEKGVDPEELTEALTAIARQQGVDAQSVIDRSLAAAKTELIAHGNAQVDLLDRKLAETDASIAERSHLAAQQAVFDAVPTFAETARAVGEEAAAQAAGTAATAAATTAVNAGLITGGGATGGLAIALGIGQWLYNRRRNRKGNELPVDPATLG